MLSNASCSKVLANKGRIQKRLPLLCIFFLLFSVESVLKPMQWQNDAKRLRAIFCKNQPVWNSDFFKNPLFLPVLFLFWSIWIPEIFFKLWWLILKLWLFKFYGIFSKNIFLAGRATLTQIIFRSQHRNTSILPK